MQNTANKKAQPWWLILLIIPMLVSCGGPTQIWWELEVFIGKNFATTVVGQVIEKIIDEVVGILIKRHPDLDCRVIPDEGNLLQGTNSCDATVKIPNVSSVVLHQPRMYRDSETSKWYLAPDERKKISCVINPECS